MESTNAFNFISEVSLHKKGLALKGDKIFASVKKAWIKKFESVLKEGGIYIMSNFGILENSGTFRVLGHAAKIDVYKQTSVKYADAFKCDQDGFVFINIKDAIAEVLNYKFGFDVKGRVISVDDMIVKKNGSKESKILNFRLQDERMQCIHLRGILFYQ